MTSQAAKARPTSPAQASSEAVAVGNALDVPPAPLVSTATRASV